MSRTFRERYRLLRSRWNEEWWSIVFGGPVGNVLNALIADVRWITPNALTVVGFLCKLVGGPLLLVRSPSADAAAVVLLQLNTVFDCMDGSLARYRKASSVLGGYLDKVTDAIGMTVVFAAVGWRVYLDTGDAAAVLVAFAVATSLVIRGYVYWVVAHLEREARIEAPSVGVDKRVDFSTLGPGARFVLYLKSMPKVLAFAESDLYFWLGLGVVLGRLREVVYGLGVATGIWFILIMAARLRTVLRLERSRRSR